MLTRILLRCTRHDTYGSWAVPHWWPTHTWLSYDFIAASKGSKAVFTICWIRAFSMFNIRCFFALASASAALALLTSSWSPKKGFKASCNKTGTPNPPNLQKCLQGWLYILCALFYNAQHHLRILISVRHYCDADRTWRPQVHLEIWMARDIPVQASCKTMSIVSWSHSLQDMTCKATFDAWPDRCNNALRGWGKHMNMLTNPVVDGNRWHHRRAQA